MNFNVLNSFLIPLGSNQLLLVTGVEEFLFAGCQCCVLTCFAHPNLLNWGASEAIIWFPSSSLGLNTMNQSPESAECVFLMDCVCFLYPWQRLLQCHLKVFFSKREAVGCAAPDC